MTGSAKQALLLPALLFSMLIISACQNDLDTIKQVSAQEFERPEQVTTNVDVIYSDSAFVRVHLVTPKMLDYPDTANNAQPYRTTPNGIRITLYDTTRLEMATLVADSAIQFDRTKIMEFHRNVVVTTPQGKTFKSEELIWDQKAKRIYSNKPSQLTDVDGLILNGMKFWSDERLTNPHMESTYGEGMFAEP